MAIRTTPALEAKLAESLLDTLFEAGPAIRVDFHAAEDSAVEPDPARPPAGPPILSFAATRGDFAAGPGGLVCLKPLPPVALPSGCRSLFMRLVDAAGVTRHEERIWP